ncbi:hypothetical protein E2P81_ATG08658 [Venturia nashicola]|uniref:Uncharacterized protein n=1 Tax=Venturia nashicola TaxID=86259 RepID=A0A4Z1NH01_9PEZI|nr:hypothetical protein E6O75_ATG08849 [Venturia nashicola]TLD20994.1 hypothetical protein E2P81_ATG08658 [Venturia nashicola]
MAVTAPTPPRRRDTAFSQASQASVCLRRRFPRSFVSTRSTSSSSAETCQDSISSYNLRWEKLKLWLELKYPELQFPKKTLVDDKYIFEVPVGKRLTQADKKDIAKLKDKTAMASVAEPRRALTPELPQDSDSEKD